MRLKRLAGSQAVSLPSQVTCTVIGVAKSQMNLLLKLRTYACSDKAFSTIGSQNSETPPISTSKDA